MHIKYSVLNFTNVFLLLNSSDCIQAVRTGKHAERHILPTGRHAAYRNSDHNHSANVLAAHNNILATVDPLGKSFYAFRCKGRQTPSSKPTIFTATPFLLVPEQKLLLLIVLADPPEELRGLNSRLSSSEKGDSDAGDTFWW